MVGDGLSNIDYVGRVVHYLAGGEELLYLSGGKGLFNIYNVGRTVHYSSGVRYFIIYQVGDFIIYQLREELFINYMGKVLHYLLGGGGTVLQLLNKKQIRSVIFVSACGGMVTNKSMILSTPGYPAAIKANLTCLWIIAIPQTVLNSTAVNTITFTTILNHVKLHNDTL